jgi:hypothetical protein
MRPGRSARRWLLGCWIAALGILSFDVGSARAQESPLGHRVLGTLGLGAGRVPAVGLYVEGEFFAYLSNRLLDRHGDVVPVDLRLRVLTTSVGISGTFKVPALHARYTLGVGVPFAWINVNVSELLEGTESGVGDIYVKPVGLGWSLSRVDLLVSYAFYIPTGHFDSGPPHNPSQAQWTHEFSVGGNLAFDARRRWQLSALASYDLNQSKIGIDITRGSQVRIQGGFDATIARILEIGPVAGALWQVSADSGSALPTRLVGAREQAVSVGGEVAVTTRKIRTRWVVRYEHDVRVRSRPLGQIVFASAEVKAF